MGNALFGLIVALCFLMMFYGVALMCWEAGREAVRTEAVQQGHAERVIIDERGNTEFRWNPNPQQKGDTDE